LTYLYININHCFPFLTDAKLSVVEYDPTTHDLKTLSLHYFEEEEIKGGRTQFVEQPLIRVDPEGRCAAMLSYGKTIVILPFRKDLGTVDENESHNLNKGSFVGESHLFKTPVLASYKLNFNDEQYADEKISNIIDFQFLNGYYEPTLLILHEPVRTWSGRVAVRQDTCAMVALSLNVHQKVHPIIWSASHLPYDCFSAIPVPRPIGGVLILAVNSLIYLNQSVPPYAVSLNSFSEISSSFPMIVQKGVKISLDCSKACFISSDKLVISLKGGELYVVTLFNDGMRSIRNFHFDKAASSVITSCLTCCEEGYLFLGSRLGNSLLLKYTEKLVEFGIKNDPENDTFLDHLDDDGNDDDGVSINSNNNSNFNYSNNNNSYNNSANINNRHEVQKEASSATFPGLDETSQEDSQDVFLYGDEDGNEKVGETNNEMNGFMNESRIEEMNSCDNEVIVNTESNQKPDNIGDWFAGDVALMKDSDELEVYGSEDDTIEKLPTTFTFELCDSIINIGPCGRICMGEPAYVPDEFSYNTDPQVELVTTSGYGKNGALCVLQRTVRPQIVTTFELHNVIDMWTVYGPSSTKDTFSSNEDQYHSLLMLTRNDSTMILQTEQEITELDHSGVSSQTPTVFAGNLNNNQYILQVSPMVVRLLEGTKQIQHIPLDLGSPIISASLADPYAVILSEQGMIVHLSLTYDQTTGCPRLIFSRPNLGNVKSKIVAMCTYKDTSGKFIVRSMNNELEDDKNKEETKNVQKSGTGFNLFEASKITMISTVDDEDELLYGNSSVEMITSLPTSDTPVASQETVSNEATKLISPADINVLKEHPPTYWLFAVRENGVLEIYNLLDFKLVYYVKNFPMGPKVLVDSVQSTDQHAQQDSALSMPITRELLVTGMGLKQSRPLLFARFDKEIFIYEAFPFFETQVENHLKLRFRKLNDTLVITEPRIFKKDDEMIQEERESLNQKFSHQRWFRPFSDISGYGGVFICGYYPHWCFMTARGELRVHEMNIDGPVTCFAPFHNVNCPKGFLYFNKMNDLRIAVLSTHVTYDAHWLARKVPLKCTINFVNYHVESKCYCIVTTTQEVYSKIVRVGGEEKDYELLERDSRYMWPTTDKFCIQLFSPVSWETIPGTKIELDEWEHVTCLKNVMLSSEGTESGLKGYIAAGTNYCYGEDVTNRGRIWILDIIDVVPELGQPLTRSKIKVLYCKEQKGPVTALCQIKGLLLSAVGQKIYIWQLKESQLVGVAFIDTQIYIQEAVSIKNLILIADFYKSISLLSYQEETRTLALVSRDSRLFEIYSCEFIVDNNHLCFLVSDRDKNLLIYKFQPETRESCGGTRLIRKADYHLGANVNSFFRIKCKYPHTNYVDQGLKTLVESKHMTVFATLDGSLHYLLPINEKIYRRLLMLQNTMNVHLQHTAGVNPKGYRTVMMHRKSLTNPCRNVLDGDLIFRFINLSMNEKTELCKKIGSTTDQVRKV